MASARPASLGSLSSILPATHRCWKAQHVSEDSRDLVLHLPAVDDRVEHPMLEKELGGLESLGKLLLDRLLDHSGTGESDERARLRKVHVTKQRVRSRYAPGGRIGKDRDIGDRRLRQPREHG